MQIVVNGQPRAIAQSTSITTLLDELNLAGQPLAVEVNQQVVPREAHAGHVLKEGDRLEVVTLVGGG